MFLFSFLFQERRDELEGLDLAIERQKTNLKDLRREEKNLNSERQSAKEDLELISKENARLKRYDMFNIYEHFTIIVKRCDMFNIYEHFTIIVKRYDMFNIYEHFTIIVKRYDMFNIYEHFTIMVKRYDMFNIYEYFSIIDHLCDKKIKK